MTDGIFRGALNKKMRDLHITKSASTMLATSYEPPNKLVQTFYELPNKMARDIYRFTATKLKQKFAMVALVVGIAILVIATPAKVDAQPYTAKLSGDVDDVFYSFVNSFGDDTTKNLYEIDFVVGDTIIVRYDYKRNSNGEIRYHNSMFFNAGVTINDYKYSNLAAELPIDGNSHLGFVRVAFATPAGASGSLYVRIIIGDSLDFDLDIHMNIAFGDFRTRFAYDTNHCEIIPKPTKIPAGSMDYYAIDTPHILTVEVNIVPKENYIISSIAIDTNKYFGTHIFHYVYNDGDSSDLDWFKLIKDGDSIEAIQISLKGFYEASDIIYPRSFELDGGIMGGGGFFLNITTEYIGIEEKTITNLHLSPNPTSNTTTLTLDLETAGSLKITLNDLLGAELFELHNAFETAGTFTKTFSIETLPTGVYFLQISHNNNTIIEKIVKE